MFARKILYPSESALCRPEKTFIRSERLLLSYVSMLAGKVPVMHHGDRKVISDHHDGLK